MMGSGSSSRKSTNGMKCTELSSEFICDIIDACGRNGVADLILGDLELSFFNPNPVPRADERVGLPNDVYNPYATPDGQQAPPNASKNQVDQELLQEIQRSQQMIDDPVGFENEMVDKLFRGED